MGRGGPPPNVVYRWEVHCLDRTTGETLWKKVALERKPTIPTHGTNTFASETPVTDGERVYAYFGMHGVFCYDIEGTLKWKKDLGAFAMQAGWGTGSSPALADDLLFIQCDNEEKSFLVALDKRTGDEVWKVQRDSNSSWSTPFVWKSGERTEVVACGGSHVRSYNAADGSLLWELGGLSGGCNATPVEGDGLLYVGCGGPFGNSPLFAVRAGAGGDITLQDDETSNAGVAWSRTRAGPSMASPLYYDGLLYILEQRGGMISCYDGQTGEPAYYRTRIPDATGFTASPWAAGSNIFCLDDSGQTIVLKAGRSFGVVGRNTVGEMCWSTPAFSDTEILLRSIDHLYCIRRPSAR
jgi:outer membrane protein assembly factor BamB